MPVLKEDVRKVMQDQVQKIGGEAGEAAETVELAGLVAEEGGSGEESGDRDREGETRLSRMALPM